MGLVEPTVPRKEKLRGASLRGLRHGGSSGVGAGSPKVRSSLTRVNSEPAGIYPAETIVQFCARIPADEEPSTGLSKPLHHRGFYGTARSVAKAEVRPPGTALSVDLHPTVFPEYRECGYRASAHAMPGYTGHRPE